MPETISAIYRGVRKWGPRILRHVRSGATSLLLPRQCACCSTTLEIDGASLFEASSLDCCERCQEELSKPYLACAYCASHNPGTANDGRCFICRDRSFRFRWAVALGPYEGALREAVLRTKKPEEHSLARLLAELLWQRERERLKAFKPDGVAAVPMHWWHRLRRGGNAPDIVCEVLARRLGIASLPNLLARQRNTLPQSNLSQKRRQLNVRHAFRVTGSYTIHGARIVLVDDILTSAATAHECAGTLRAAGAAEVVVAVLARADRPM